MTSAELSVAFFLQMFFIEWVYGKQARASGELDTLSSKA